MDDSDAGPGSGRGPDTGPETGPGAGATAGDPDRPAPAATLPASVIERYPRFSLYNSPYVAHDDGSAVDLYLPGGRAPSPVAGRVRDTRSVRAPPKPYADPEDHLVVLAPEDPARLGVPEGSALRVMHVDPAVEPGDAVAAGENLGRPVDSGFFAPWVGDHLHVGVRPPGADPYRASGSLPLSVDVPVEPVAWDGVGCVVEREPTYLVLDGPDHPAPEGPAYAALAGRLRLDGDGDGDEGEGDGGPGAGDGDLGTRAADPPRATRRVGVDGGLPHYEGGGAYDGTATLPDPPPSAAPRTGAVTVDGAPVGRARGRTVEWSGPTVRANGHPVRGLSLTVGRESLPVTVVAPDADLGLAVGDELRVTVGADDG